MRLPLARPMAEAQIGPAGRRPAGPESRPRGAAGQGRWLDLEAFAAASGLHPELVVRLVALGLIEPAPAGPPSTEAGKLSAGRTGGRQPAPGSPDEEAAQLRFAAAQVATAARIQRLRIGLGLNYAAIGLVLDLLDRVDELETALARQNGSRRGGTPWTRTG